MQVFQDRLSTSYLSLFHKDYFFLPQCKQCTISIYTQSSFTVTLRMGLYFGLNIVYSSQDMIKDQAEQNAMFSPLHG